MMPTPEHALCGLPRAASIALCAQALFYCHAELYGQLGRFPHWESLSALEQHAWVQRAQDVMETLRPAPTVFEQAVALARTAGARILAFGPDRRA